MSSKDQSGKKLQTDMPLSEKDEVKQAEHKMAKAAKKGAKESLKGGIKSKEK